MYTREKFRIFTIKAVTCAWSCLLCVDGVVVCSKGCFLGMLKIRIWVGSHRYSTSMLILCAWMEIFVDRVFQCTMINFCKRNSETFQFGTVSNS